MLLKTKLLISLGVVGVVSTTGTGIYWVKNSSQEVGTSIQPERENAEDRKAQQIVGSPQGAGGGSVGTEAAVQPDAVGSSVGAGDPGGGSGIGVVRTSTTPPQNPE